MYGIYFSQNLEIVTIFVLFVIGAAAYGSLTADKKIILKQGGPAILALISIFSLINFNAGLILSSPFHSRIREICYTCF